MKRTKELLIIVSLGLFFLTSCISKYEKITHLTKAELEWANMYAGGEVIYFQSNRNNTDTLNVAEQLIHNSTYPYYTWGIDYIPSSTYIASIAYTLFLLNEEKYNDFGGYLYLHLIILKQLDNQLYVILYDSFFKPLEGYTNNNRISNILTHFVIDNDTINDCLIFKYPNYEYKEKIKNKKSPLILEYVISKEFGLIYYKFDDGEEFTRVFE